MKNSKLMISSLLITLPLAASSNGMDEMEMERQRHISGGRAYHMQSESRQLDENQRARQVLDLVGEESRRTKHFVGRGYISQPTPQSVFLDYLTKVNAWLSYLL